MKYFWSLLAIAMFLSCSDDFFPNEPGALTNCSIGNLEVTTGDCTENRTYLLSIDFSVANADNELFEVFIRNDEPIGSFPLSDLPLQMEEFQPSGLAEDYIKICISGNADCCAEIEFTPPPCITGNPTNPGDTLCTITLIETQTGDCTSDSTYVLDVNFEYVKADNELFDLYIREEVLLNSFNLEDLPIRLDSFLTSGLEQDFIRICINDNPDCCAELEFPPPACIE